MLPPFRKNLSAPGMYKTIYMEFSKIEDQRSHRQTTISLADSLMSGLAMFSLKYPSLLQFDRERGDDAVENNLKTLYGINDIPSDTQMREINDCVDPNAIRTAFKAVFSSLQRSKALESFQYLYDHYLVSIDGTGHLTSETISCSNCLERTSKTGKVTYYHQAVGAVIVHPDIRQVIPLDVEPIKKQDGNSKNDCERNSSKRLLANLRKVHPKLKIILVEDALAANAPHINLAKSQCMHFIFGVKSGDHKYLFEFVEHSYREGKVEEFEFRKDVSNHVFRIINNVPLNKENQELSVNFMEYWEERENKTLHFTWITDLTLSKNNAYMIMKGGRSRWKIENETFNTLKNQGYQFEHNFGHGEKNLATNFLLLMMLAFLVDQAQQFGCLLFQKARKLRSSNRDLWEKMRAIFVCFLLDGWHAMFEMLILGTPDKRRSRANPPQGP